ncbi:MAG: hypothetical protein F4X40_03390 [Chloroflexi bacterium]|nr:hypothetical protein [Chloroflexota bacterium]
MDWSDEPMYRAYLAGHHLKTRVQEMQYSDEQLDRIYEEYGELTRKKSRLIKSYVSRQFRDERAAEYARHGFCRRVHLMAHCIQGVFERLPPERARVPEDETVRDATVYLQAFVFNTFGSIDNLAHVWVSERPVKKADGRSLARASIGFGKKYKRVMESLPEGFRDSLNELEPWREYQRSFRDALAHRIPLYIPPSYVTQGKAEEYERKGAQILDAIRRSEFEEAEALEDAQNELISFLPVATHSFKEQSKLVYFHCQMLADFNTIDEIAWRMLRTLDE